MIGSGWGNRLGSPRHARKSIGGSGDGMSGSRIALEPGGAGWTDRLIGDVERGFEGMIRRQAIEYLVESFLQVVEFLRVIVKLTLHPVDSSLVKVSLVVQVLVVAENRLFFFKKVFALSMNVHCPKEENGEKAQIS